MATPAFRPSSCVWQGSSTSTTGGDITLDVVASPGKLNFRDKYLNGATGVPLELYDSTTGIQEFSYGTLVYGASAALDKITSRVITYSSNGPGTPVAWGAGTRNAFCSCAAESFLFAENALAEMNDTQALNAWLRLSSVAISGSGGTSARTVRYVSSNTFTDAFNTDANSDLSVLLFKFGTTYYPSGAVVAGLTSLGFSSGQRLWLGTNSTPLLTSAPVPSSTLRLVEIGKMLSIDRLLLSFSRPVGG